MPSKRSTRKKPASAVKRPTSLKRGDMVMVIAGGNKEKRAIKGQIGKIAGFRGRDRVIVEGVNLITKHQRQTGPKTSSGKIQKEAAIHISNVMYYVEKLKRPARLKHSFLADGTKVRGYVDPETKEFVQI